MDRVSLDAVASAFGFDDRRPRRWAALGKVQAVNADGSLSVLIGGATAPTDCAAYCTAAAGDVVYVAVEDGKARAIARQGGDGGGSGGTTDYDQLSNRPQINGVTLTGDKSAADLGITDTTDLAQMTGTLPIAHGGTGATTAADALTALGLPSGTVAALEKIAAGEFVKLVTATSGQMGSGDWNATISATIPDGYVCVGWLMPRTNGWVGTAYVGGWSVSGSTATANVYWNSGGNGTVAADAICIWKG